MTIGPVDAPGFSLPSLPVGAEVAIDEINTSGGLNGRPVKLITCNDKNDPNVAAQCAKQAVDEKVAAVVGGLTLFEAQALPVLQAAGIPWIGLTSSNAFDQKGVYLIGGDGASAFTAIGATLAKAGCKSVAVIVSANAAPPNAKQIEAGVTAFGSKVVASLAAPANGGDFAPTVAAARSAGADCVAAGTGPPETGPLISAIKAGEPLKFAIADGGLPDVVLSQLGAAADGVLATSGFPPASSNIGVVKTLAEKAQAKNAKASFDQFARTGYAAVTIVKEAAKGAKDLSPAALTAALSTLTKVDTGLGPVLDLSKPSTIKGYERIFNSKIYVLVAKGGKYELSQPEPLDMTPALTALSGQK